MLVKNWNLRSDRIGQNRGGGRFLLSSGRGAMLKEQQPLSTAPFIVAAELDDAGADSRIFLAAPVQEEQLRQYLPELLAETIQTAWDERAKAVRSIRRERLGALTLKEDVVIATDRTQVLAALLQGVRLEGLGLLPWTPASRQLQARLQFMHRVAEWPDASDEGLLATLEMWLGPYAEGVKNAQQLISASSSRSQIASARFGLRSRSSGSTAKTAYSSLWFQPCDKSASAADCSVNSFESSARNTSEAASFSRCLRPLPTSRFRCESISRKYPARESNTISSLAYSGRSIAGQTSV